MAKSINPYSGKLLKSYPEISKAELIEKLERSQSAFSDYKQTSLSERKRLLLAAQKLLLESKKSLSRLITLEMGKRLSEAEYEIDYCASILKYYAESAEEFLAEQAIAVEDAEATLSYTPLGPLLGIMPWNFPFYQVIRFAAPNLMAGNTVLIKHAGNVPQCAEALENLFSNAGFPSGVYTNLFIPTEFVGPIISHKFINGVSLTGSEKAGAAVAAMAGENVKKSVLELGGNDPFIVLEDADLELAIQQGLEGRMVNNGQSCVASKRFIVVEPLAKKFIAGMKKAMGKLVLGDPLDESTDLGPLASEEAVTRLAAQVEQSIRNGAKVILGGSRPKISGAFYSPTILTAVSSDNPSFDEELFGPVATIYTVKTEQEAVELANHSSFGLGGSVFSSDQARALEVAKHLETGMAFINQRSKSQAELPFGGIKKSGYGRELSHLGILEFVNKKLIYLPTEE